jgi:8-oxo-dGTP pyrophosphatase MutT (NUDIX family)
VFHPFVRNSEVKNGRYYSRMSMKEMYCNNCGEKGHVFRTCREPVISCGVLLLRGIYEPLKLPVDPKTVSVLMVKRKDSMSYMEFIRGKYDPDDVEYTGRLILNMTQTEQKFIVEEEFDTLWTRLWGAGRDSHSQEYSISKDKYTKLDRKMMIERFPSPYKDTEWGIPKGRRSRGESDEDCATREFLEETNISRDCYELTKISFTETFKGTNNIDYRHIYFVALLRESRSINLKQKLTPMQSKEVAAVDWKTLSECKNIIRPHYAERKALITDVEKFVSNYHS